MKKFVTYDGNDQETYSLLKDEKVVAEILTGEDGAIEIAGIINIFLNKKTNKDTNIVIQNDGDKLGIIVDLYKGDECFDSLTLWFDDFRN